MDVTRQQCDIRHIPPLAFSLMLQFKDRFRPLLRSRQRAFFPSEMSNLFAKLDGQAIAAEFRAGGLLFRHGDPVAGAYTIRKGKVALIWTSKDGVTPMHTQGPGTVLGLPAVLNGEYSLSARAVEDCELGFLPASRVLQLLELDQAMMREVIRLLAAEVARMRSLLRTAAEEGTVDISTGRKQ